MMYGRWANGGRRARLNVGRLGTERGDPRLALVAMNSGPLSERM